MESSPGNQPEPKQPNETQTKDLLNQVHAEGSPSDSVLSSISRTGDTTLQHPPQGDGRRIMKVNDPRRRKFDSPHRTVTESSGVDDDDSSLKPRLEKLITHISDRQLQRYEYTQLDKQYRLTDRDKQKADRNQMKGPYREQLDIRSNDIRSRLEAKKSRLDQLKKSKNDCLEAFISELFRQINQPDNNLECACRAIVTENEARYREQGEINQKLEARLDLLSKEISTANSHEPQKKFTKEESNTDSLSEDIVTLKAVAEKSRNDVISLTEGMAALRHEISNLKSVLDGVDSTHKDREAMKKDIETLVSKQDLQGYVVNFNSFRQGVVDELNGLQSKGKGTSHRLESLESSLNEETNHRKALATTVQNLVDSPTTKFVQMTRFRELEALVSSVRAEKDFLSARFAELSATFSKIAAGHTNVDAQVQQMKRSIQEVIGKQSSTSKSSFDEKATQEEIKKLKENCDKNFGLLSEKYDGVEHTIKALNSRYNNLSSDTLARQIASITDQKVAAIQPHVIKLQADMRTVEEALLRDTTTHNRIAKVEKCIADTNLKVEQYGTRMSTVEAEFTKRHASDGSQAATVEGFRTSVLQELRESQEKINTSGLQEVLKKHEAINKAYKSLSSEIEKVRSDLSEHTEIARAWHETHVRDTDRVNEVCSVLSNSMNKTQETQKDILKRVDDINKLRVGHADNVTNFNNLRKELSTHVEKMESSRRELFTYIEKVDSLGTERHTAFTGDVLDAKKSIEDQLEVARHERDDLRTKSTKISQQLEAYIGRPKERRGAAVETNPSAKSRPIPSNLSESVGADTPSPQSIFTSRLNTVSTPGRSLRQEISDTEDSAIMPASSIKPKNKSTAKSPFVKRKDKKRSSSRETTTVEQDTKPLIETVDESGESTTQGDTITVAQSPVVRAFGGAHPVDLTQDDDSDEVSVEMAKWRPRTSRDGSSITGTPKSSNSSLKRKKDVHRTPSGESPSGSTSKKSRKT